MISPGFDRRALPADARIGTWHAPDGWAHRRFDWDSRGDLRPRGRLLFQTGRSDFLEKYLEAFAHWHAQGWAITAFDWRGQGGSGRRADEGSFAPLVADLAAFVAEWTQEAPGPHAMIGHSMGGYLAIRMLIAGQAAGIRSVVLVAPMLGLNSAPIPVPLAHRIATLASRLGLAARPAWREGAKPGFGRRKQLALTSSIERFEDAAWWRATRPELGLGPPSWGWLAAAYRAVADLRRPGVLEAIATPVLLLGVERDRIVRTADIRAAAARIPGAEIEIYPTPAAHELLREADEYRLAALARIDGFLDRTAPA